MYLGDCSVTDYIDLVFCFLFFPHDCVDALSGHTLIYLTCGSWWTFTLFTYYSEHSCGLRTSLLTYANVSVINMHFLKVRGIYAS